MRRITLWISVGLIIVVLIIAYQINQSGGGVKGGETNNSTVPAACQTPAPSSSPCPTGSKAADDGADTDHTDKPGENK
jgi:hypothetical protein